MTVAARPTEYADASLSKSRRRRWPYWIIALLMIGGFFAVLVPSMCAPREAANVIKSQSNLRQIGLALAVYAGGNRDALPPDFATLIRTADLTPDAFVSPLDSKDKAPGRTAEEWSGRLAAEPEKYCSYRYVAGGLTLTDLGVDALLAYEPAIGRTINRTNLLFADGHVEDAWVSVGTSARAAFDRLSADDAAGVRPLRWRP